MKSLSKLEVNVQLLLYIDKFFPHFDARQIYINNDSRHTFELTVVAGDGNSQLIDVPVEKLQQWVSTHELAIIPIKITPEDELEVHDVLLNETLDNLDRD